MSLFPAYAADVDGVKADKESEPAKSWNVQLEPMEGEAVAVQAAAALALEEAALLASDSSEEDAPPPASRQPLPDVDFYVDGRADNANLGVSTLYYPGRPIYTRAVHTLGVGGAAGAGEGSRRRGRRRYYLQPAAPAEPSAREVSAREHQHRQMLAASPQDEDLWRAFLRFQEEWGESAAWLAACEEAVRSVGRRGGCAGELHRARRAHCTPQDLLKAITKDIHDEKCPSARLEHWLRLLWTLSGGAGAGAGAGGAAGEVQVAAHAALQDLPHEPRAYPLVLYVYGSALRAAGLWEQLVLLLELVCAVNYPRCDAFPPPAPAPDDARAREQRLLRDEDDVISSGLPLSTVWVRVERLRAAAHWRAAGGGGEGQAEADPQRSPAAAEVAPMLRAVRPAATLLMCVSMLRLAQVPLLPMSTATQRACGAGDAEEGDALGAALPALYRAARRLPLPPAAPAAPAAALRRALHHLLDPPHCFTDDAGYLSWTTALWDACCGWMEGRRRVALACWRLRWLHALALLAPPDEARRLRAQARRVLKLHAPEEPVAFALFARLEADVGQQDAARRAALQAVRVSCGSARTERCAALFAARVLREVVGAREPALCCAALCAAVLQRALTEDTPTPDVLADALEECSKRCGELERGFEADGGEAGEADAEAARALVCGAGEWGAARVALLAPAARRDALAALLVRGRARLHASPESAHYYEASACALALAAAEEARRGEAARALAPLFPGSALLALAAEAAPLWARAGAGAGGARGRLAALARVLPRLLRAPLDPNADPTELCRLARCASRACSECGADAALGALRLEAEARAPSPAHPAHPAHRALLAALAAHPNHKWVYVRGAAWVPAEAEALCDAALERGLRLHALTHELHPLTAPTAPTCV